MWGWYKIPNGLRVKLMPNLQTRSVKCVGLGPFVINSSLSLSFSGICFDAGFVPVSHVKESFLFSNLMCANVLGPGTVSLSFFTTCMTKF